MKRKRLPIPQSEMPGMENIFNLASEIVRVAASKPEQGIECQGAELFTCIPAKLLPHEAAAAKAVGVTIVEPPSRQPIIDLCPHGHPIQDCNCKDEAFPAYEHADAIPLG